MAGCKDAKDYYERNSSSRFLSDVKVTLLGPNAGNDPIASKTILYKAVSSGDSFVFATTKDRGHLRWFTQQNRKLKRRYMRPVVEFLIAIATNQSPASALLLVLNNGGVVCGANRPEIQCREIDSGEIPADVWRHVNATSLSNKGC